MTRDDDRCPALQPQAVSVVSWRGAPHHCRGWAPVATLEVRAPCKWGCRGWTRWRELGEKWDQRKVSDFYKGVRDAELYTAQARWSWPYSGLRCVPLDLARIPSLSHHDTRACCRRQRRRASRPLNPSATSVSEISPFWEVSHHCLRWRTYERRLARMECRCQGSPV